jgi:hypothetical protein
MHRQVDDGQQDLEPQWGEECVGLAVPPPKDEGEPPGRWGLNVEDPICD